jgi:hypothetical protein
LGEIETNVPHEQGTAAPSQVRPHLARLGGT